MRRTFRTIRLLCGCLVVYITVGGLLAFALDRPYSTAVDCFPQTSAFAVLVSNCDNSMVNLFWSVIAGWPRFVIVVPALVFAGVHAFAKNGFHYWFYLDNAIPFAVLSIPLVLVSWGGISYWIQMSRTFAAAQTALLLGEILYLGARM